MGSFVLTLPLVAFLNHVGFRAEGHWRGGPSPIPLQPPTLF
eukprot:gene5765-56095_t